MDPTLHITQQSASILPKYQQNLLEWFHQSRQALLASKSLMPEVLALLECGSDLSVQMEEIEGF